MAKSLTYKKSGVDIEKAKAFVKNIQSLVATTMTEGVLQKTGAFGSFFALKPNQYKEPVLVSSTDGVGTKLLIAKHLDKHDTIGIDLVAMNVNDVLCAGAKPLFFLDYIACGQIKPKLLEEVVSGIVEGCQFAGCSLIGGETAEMPGLYQKDDYDLAGFAVGVVEKDRIIDGSAMKAGDRIIGLAASGLHSNGYSLVRKVFSLKEQKKLAKTLLEPTRIYVEPVLQAIESFEIKGIAHNTGGAFYEKLTKIVPQGKCLKIDKSAWPVPEIFQMIQKIGKITEKEMHTTFNMGIGMILVVSSKDSQSLRQFMSQRGLPAWDIGEVVEGKQKIVLK